MNLYIDTSIWLDYYEKRARDNDALLVSRDKHFEQLAGVINIKKPEELI